MTYCLKKLQDIFTTTYHIKLMVQVPVKCRKGPLVSGFWSVWFGFPCHVDICKQNKIALIKKCKPFQKRKSWSFSFFHLLMNMLYVIHSFNMYLVECYFMTGTIWDMSQIPVLVEVMFCWGQVDSKKQTKQEEYITYQKMISIMEKNAEQGKGNQDVGPGKICKGL